MTSSWRAEPGQTLGRYRLVERLGRGGMAEVFKAKSFGAEGFEKLVVIKRIVPELVVHPKFVEMFVREAKLAVRLSHANIVQVFDLGKEQHDEGEPEYFIAMEYVPGLDVAALLDHYRRNEQQLPLGAAVYIAAEVAKALDHAHRRRNDAGEPAAVIHRDISPHNILLSWDGEVKVTDFGIARAVDVVDDESHDDLQAVRTSGKVAFMSPEQARADTTDPRSDLFSLGTVLYQLITGANPFSAPTVAETLRRVGASEYPPLALSRPDATKELQALVDHLLAADPNDRMPDASTLSEQLLAYAYTSGDRFSASDMAALLSPLRDTRHREDVAEENVLDDTVGQDDRTPVEIPRSSNSPPPTTTQNAGLPVVVVQTGERREVSIVVLSTGQAPVGKETLEHVRDVFDRHGAWIEESGPQKLVALFGLGDTDGRDAEAAVRSALTLVRQRSAGSVPSAGIHSGSISVDDGGLPVRDDRLKALQRVAESLAHVDNGTVAISPVTSRLVRRSFVTEPLPASARAVTDGGYVVHRALEESQAGRFIGHHKELKTLGATLAAATREGQQLVVMRGPSGIGKTRLLTEAKRRLEHGKFNLAVYTARCPLHGTTVPWSGLRAMLHVLCGTQEDDDAGRILEVRPRLAALGLEEHQVAAMVELLGGPLSTHASETRAVVRNAFERMVMSLCRDRLHCLAWDDAQALDRETLDLILRVMRKRRRLRVTFLLVQRGELPPLLSRWRDLKVVEVGELSKKDTKRLIQWRLGARSLPEPLLDYVYRCTGGHPLFISELLRDLCDDSTVQVMNGNVNVVRQLQASAPRPLRALITQRVSRLPQREVLLLQSLAVIGEPGLVQVLSQLGGQEPGTIERTVTRLENQGLLQRVGTSQVRFSSPLYQEVILEAMPHKLQRQLHERAAETFKNAYLTSPGLAAERVANHLLGAGKRHEAVESFWLSARERLARLQFEAALNMMLRGLQLTRPSAQSPDVLLGWLVDVAKTVSQVRRAANLKDLLTPILGEIKAKGDEQQRTRAYIEMARALGSVNLFDDAYEALRAAGADDVDDDGIKRAALAVTAQLAARQGLFARVVEAGEKLEGLHGVDHIETLYSLVVARSMTEQPQEALALLARIEKLQPRQDAADEVEYRKHHVLVLFNARRFDEAAKGAIELARLASNHGLRFDAAAALHNLGDIYDRLGDHPRAYAAFMESITLTKQLEHDRLTSLNQMHLCVLDGLRTPEGVEDRLKALIRAADGHGYIWDVLQGRYLLARLWAAHGHHTKAHALLTKLLKSAEEGGHKFVADDVASMLETLGDRS